MPAEMPQGNLYWHFTGVYPDDAISDSFGRIRRWSQTTPYPERVVAAHLVGLWPFESVTYIRCPEQRICCSC